MSGFGNIQKTGKYSWKLTVSCGFDGNGKRIRHTRTVKANTKNIEIQKKEAKKALALFQTEVEQGNIAVSGKMKLKDLAEKWFTEHCQKELAPKTQQSYKLHLEKRIIPALGNIYISKLRPIQIIEFINNLKEPGLRLDKKGGTLSDESVMYCYRVLSSMLQDAVQWQIIAFNPCARVKPPKVMKNKAVSNIYNEEQTMRLIAALETALLNHQIIVLLAIAIGLRLGELCGLKWEDIDLKNNLIKVNRASQSLSGLGTFDKTPKNNTSIRVATNPTELTTLLKQYKTEQTTKRLTLGLKKNGGLWEGDQETVEGDRLFTQWNGLPVYVQTPSQWFHKFLLKYNDTIQNNETLTEEQKAEQKLPIIRFHDLRHTSGSLLIAKGIPLKNISSRLGHANIQTTANIYCHALQSVDEQIAATMNDIIFPSKREQAD